MVVAYGFNITAFVYALVETEWSSSPMIDLSGILLDDHLHSFRAISGAVIFYGSRLDSGSQKYVLVALK